MVQIRVGYIIYCSSNIKSNLKWPIKMSIINSIITIYKNGSFMDYINFYIVFPDFITNGFFSI